MSEAQDQCRFGKQMLCSRTRSRFYGFISFAVGISEENLPLQVCESEENHSSTDTAGSLGVGSIPEEVLNT